MVHSSSRLDLWLGSLSIDKMPCSLIDKRGLTERHFYVKH